MRDVCEVIILSLPQTSLILFCPALSFPFAAELTLLSLCRWGDLLAILEGRSCPQWLTILPSDLSRPAVGRPQFLAPTTTSSSLHSLSTKDTTRPSVCIKIENCQPATSCKNRRYGILSVALRVLSRTRSMPICLFLEREGFQLASGWLAGEMCGGETAVEPPNRTVRSLGAGSGWHVKGLGAGTGVVFC